MTLMGAYTLLGGDDRDTKEGRICARLINVYHKNHRQKIFD